MFKTLRERRLARALAASWCDGCSEVCTPECRSDTLRQRARDTALAYSGSSLR